MAWGGPLQSTLTLCFDAWGGPSQSVLTLRSMAWGGPSQSVLTVRLMALGGSANASTHTQSVHTPTVVDGEDLVSPYSHCIRLHGEDLSVHLTLQSMGRT